MEEESKKMTKPPSKRKRPVKSEKKEDGTQITTQAPNNTGNTDAIPDWLK